MTHQELEILLKERANSLDLKKIAFENLDKIFIENSEVKGFLGGFGKEEIITAFDYFDYRVDGRNNKSLIITKIGLYVENGNYVDKLQPIGYYELETNLDGDLIDDWLVISKEKHLNGLEVIDHFQRMNEKLPKEYLKRNHTQYEFVSYVSLVGTLFLSKDFEGAGHFIRRALVNIESIGSECFDKVYLKHSMSFLQLIGNYLFTNELVSEDLKNVLGEFKNDNSPF